MREDCPVKRDDENLVKHAGAAHFFDDRFDDMGIVAILVATFAGFDFDIDLNVAPGEVEDFAQGGYLLRFRPAAGEVGSGIEAAQVGKVEVEDAAMVTGEFVDGVVVKDDGMTIAAHVDITFYSVDGEGESVAEGGKGVFWSEMVATTMGDALYMVTHKGCCSPLHSSGCLHLPSPSYHAGLDRWQGELLLYIMKKTERIFWDGTESWYEGGGQHAGCA